VIVDDAPKYWSPAGELKHIIKNAVALGVKIPSDEKK